MTVDNVELPFDAWSKANPIDYDHCFLCWTPLTDTNRTDEHVFPKWLQRDFKLFDQRLTLPNKTWMAYRSVRIPCCRECNNNTLSRLEDEIGSGVRAGFETFRHTPKLKQFQWLQCLLYKMLYRDMSLLQDRANPASGTMTSATDLSSLRLSHVFLRSIDRDVSFKNFFPASLYLVRVKTSADVALNFDYVDSIPDQCLGIRMNDIGIIAALRDGALQEQIVQPLRGLLDKEFNPVQFRNLFAKVLYQQTLFTDPLNYVVNPIGDESLEVEAVFKDSKEFGGSFVYRSGDPEGYGQVLSQVIGSTVDALRLADGSIGSLLFDKDGRWRDRSFDDDGSAPKTV